jgi:hypothetical protein
MTHEFHMSRLAPCPLACDLAMSVCGIFPTWPAQVTMPVRGVKQTTADKPKSTLRTTYGNNFGTDCGAKAPLMWTHTHSASKLTKLSRTLRADFC